MLTGVGAGAGGAADFVGGGVPVVARPLVAGVVGVVGGAGHELGDEGQPVGGRIQQAIEYMCDCNAGV